MTEDIEQWSQVSVRQAQRSWGDGAERKKQSQIPCLACTNLANKADSDSDSDSQTQWPVVQFYEKSLQ